jgi:hypothetical protein
MPARTPRPLDGLGPRRILRPARVAAAVLVGALALAACGDSPNTAASSSPSVRSGSDVQSGSNAATFVTASLGEPISFLGLKVTLSTMTQGGDPSGPWLTVHVRAENGSGQPRANPNFGITCASSEQTGSWQDASTTFKAGHGLPAGSFDEGDVNLLLPGDSRTGHAVPACSAPAVVRASPIGVIPNTDGPEGGSWSIADDLVAGLNAATAH